MLQPNRNMAIPELTQLVAQAAFPNGSLFITLRDDLGPVFEDEAIAAFYPSLGQPAESPGRLAMVTVMQFAENLTDRQAADAVRGRIDWKYALGLELSDPGFHSAVRELAIVDIMRRIWVQQFYRREGKAHWRTKKQWGQPPAGLMIASTEDLEAKYCVKRSTEWTGYKVHLTELLQQPSM